MIQSTFKPLQGISGARWKLTEGEWTRWERLLFTSRFWGIIERFLSIHFNGCRLSRTRYVSAKPRKGSRLPKFTSRCSMESGFYETRTFNVSSKLVDNCFRFPRFGEGRNKLQQLSTCLPMAMNITLYNTLISCNMKRTWKALFLWFERERKNPLILLFPSRVVFMETVTQGPFSSTSWKLLQEYLKLI